jgi:hypothetical protein
MLLLCLTEVSGLLMSSVCKINALLAGSGWGGEGNARGARAVDFKQGTSEDRICHHEQGIAFPSMIIFL